MCLKSKKVLYTEVPCNLQILGPKKTHSMTFAKFKTSSIYVVNKHKIPHLQVQTTDFASENHFSSNHVIGRKLKKLQKTYNDINSSCFNFLSIDFQVSLDYFWGISSNVSCFTTR